jgi:S-methylmethionine-dependent homocysteine/selenocysteine methylase
LSYALIKQKLAKKETIILDGGTGTDIQRRGAPMSGEVWCAEVNGTHIHIVEEVHRDYVKAGADIITANTFATSCLAFNYRGRDADVARLDSAAMRAAKRAVHGTHVAVAASVSTQRPVIPGTDRTDMSRNWTEVETRKLYGAKIANLKAEGADLIMTEMMRDADYSLWASRCAVESGLPVWIGISLESNADGKLVGFGRPDQLFEDFGPKLAALNPDVVSIMHTSPNDTPKAIRQLRSFWDGPVGCYPESGYFKSPDWQFVDIISPHDLVDHAKQWRGLGATAFGGCCGIGAEHIVALKKEML